MTTRDEPWPQGTPAWVDLMVPDRQRAREFYGTVLGWDFTDEAPAEMGHYAQALVEGRTAAGVGERSGPDAPPPAWTTYLAVDDVDSVVERATAAGATVLAPAMDVGDNGRLAVLADPTGAVVGLWQSGTHTGVQIANVPGTIAWNEVMTRDYERAQEFYGAVFGYTFGDMSTEDFTYATIALDGHPVGGIGRMPADMPAEVPPHWMTYFMVDDADAAVARATQLGGQVRVEPRDTEFGRMVVLAGPFGEVFSLMGRTPEPEESPLQG
jgi:predicted enzyme related to lactoylglutathione lyase